MAQNNRVLTAPLAVITVGGNIVGKMRDVRISETFRRGRVLGLGDLTPQELPALEWQGTLSCSFYTIDWEQVSTLPGAILRDVTSLQSFIDSVLLQENGVDATLMKKIKTPGDPNPPIPLPGTYTGIWTTVALVRGLFLEREGMDVTEASISGKNQEFQYMTPIWFN